MGKAVIEQLKKRCPSLETYAIGTNSTATANSLLGEITPAMSVAIGSSSAYKIFIPVNRCNHMIVGCKDTTLTEYINLVCDEVERRMAEYENRRI